VRLDADSSPIDFVRILLFTDFSQIAEQKDAMTSALPPLSTADAAEVAGKVKAMSAPPTAASPKAGPAATADAQATAKTLANALAASKAKPAPKQPPQPSPATTPPPDDDTP